MSTTPRTDAAEVTGFAKVKFVWPTFARTLERELTEAKADNQKFRTILKLSAERVPDDSVMNDVMEAMDQQNDQLRADLDRVRQSLRQTVAALDRAGRRCEWIHHAKGEYHSGADPCPVEQLITEAEASARAELERKP